MLTYRKIARCVFVWGFAFLIHSGACGEEAVAEKTAIETRVLAKTSNSWDGNILPGYPQGQGEITVLDIKIPPGVKLPTHLHPVMNAGYMVSGELTVVTERGDILHLKEGEAIVEVVDTWHYGYNEGDKPAEIVVFYAGAEGSPISEYRQDAE